ncbi:interleukin-17A-like [Aquarana catesbeiana]|uniref:interleukin-17A-like n=1 Tax=Aquarana catesbeiana TaxID=8400 RepID=UPI003CC952B1
MPLPRVFVMLAVIVSAVLLGDCSKRCLFPKDKLFRLNLNTSIDLGYIMEGEVHLRSLSPWSYKIDEDVNRIPAIIRQAVCQHHWCLDAEGKADNGMMSMPIQMEILVLRQDCQQKIFVETQLVTVGCTCTTYIAKSA